VTVIVDTRLKSDTKAGKVALHGKTLYLLEVSPTRPSISVVSNMPILECSIPSLAKQRVL